MPTNSTSLEPAAQQDNEAPLKAADMSSADVEFMLACLRCFESDGIVRRFSLSHFDHPIYLSTTDIYFEVNLSRVCQMVGHGALKTTRNRVWALKTKYGISYLPTRLGTVSSPESNNNQSAQKTKGTANAVNASEVIAGAGTIEPDTPCPKRKGRARPPKRAIADDEKVPNKRRRQEESDLVEIAKAAETLLDSIEISQKNVKVEKAKNEKVKAEK
jgi:hypothetical protein